MKKVTDFNLTKKSVIVRADFNVPLDEEGHILDDFRIKRSLPTIKYLIKKKAKIIIISHLGRPKPFFDIKRNKKYNPSLKKYSLKIVAQRLEKLLDQKIYFLGGNLESHIKERTREISPGNVILLENLRFYKGEEENNARFAKELAHLGNIFINDAFSVCHRAHASIVGIPQYLPSGAGFSLDDEISHLAKVRDNPQRPLLVIMGGVKFDTKIKFINHFLQKVDYLILGAEIVQKILDERIKGEKDDLSRATLREIDKMDLESRKLVFPEDVVIKTKNSTTKEIFLNEVKESERIMDIGKETVGNFINVINKSKTVLWNGPLGYIEDKKFAVGSLDIAKAIVKSRNYAVVGGGDTSSFLGRYKLRDKFGYISTGGGAMLAFLAGERLPGLEALGYKLKSKVQSSKFKQSSNSK